MRRKIALAAAAFIVSAGSMGLGSAAPDRACPEASRNPGGTPPNCGQVPAEPTETCPDGIVTGPADELTQGNLTGPLCQIHEGVEGATGIPL